jgi:hypothetical protein
VEEKDLFIYGEIRSNIILINNKSVEFVESVIHFTKLWSSIGRRWAEIIEQGVSGFCFINYKGTRLGVDDFNSIHRVSMLFLEQAFQKFEGEERIY